MLAARDWELWTSRCRIVVTEATALDEAAAIADELLAGVERAASRFRGDSEVLGLAAGWNTISPLLADLVGASLEAARLSDGAVDPTVGATLSGLGYDRTITEVRSDRQTRFTVVPAVPGWRSLVLDGDRLFRPAEVQLDLGATAKAVAADRLAEAVATRLGTGALVSLGGDIATAGEPPEGGWQVTVQDLPSDTPQQITLHAGAAVATSSTAKRTWHHDGQPMHHLLDPATGAPAGGPWRTVTVVSHECALANTASTGAIVKGYDAVRWLRELGFPARLTDHAGRTHSLNGFPQEVAA